MRKRNNDFRRYFDLMKVEKLDDGSGAVRVSGVLSTETPDEDKEIITREAMADAIPDYMKFGAVREMHDDIAAGVMLHVEVGEDGITRCEADIVDEGTIKKLLHDPPILKGWSVGGKKLARDPENKKRITKIRLSEASLVDRPNNHDCLVELAKFSGGGEGDTPEGGDDMSLFEALKLAMESDDLKKSWAGEEVWDSTRAASALDTIISLLCKEMGETGEDPGQVEGLTKAVQGLKQFIASEIQENTILKASHADDLAKAGKKFSKDTQDKLSAAHDHLQKCSDAMAKCSDHLMKATEAVKGTGALDPAASGDVTKASEPEDLRKASALSEEISTLRAENEDLKKASGAKDQKLEDLRKASSALREEHEALKKTSEEAGALIQDLLQKRAASVKVVDKGKDTGLNTEEPEDLTKRAPANEGEAFEQARTLIARTIRGTN